MQIYKVGGYVRDKLLGLIPHDCDYVVVGSTPTEMLARGFERVGRNFPVFLHPQTKEEYALARQERKTAAGHTGFIVNSSPEITLEEDLSRRDLTINAIAEDELGNYIDPYNGQQDLKNKILRHISPAFKEDPLRILRVARFAAQLNFNVAGETMELLKKMALSGEGQTISRERVVVELDKALNCISCSNFFRILFESGNLSVFFPALAQRVIPCWQIFIDDLSHATTNEARWLILARYLNTNNIKTLSELTLHKSRYKTLSKVFWLNLLLNTPIRHAEETLTIYRHLDIWRSHQEFKQLAKIYETYLRHTDAEFQKINLLHERVNLADQLVAIPIAKIIQNLDKAHVSHAIHQSRIATIHNFHD